MLRRQRYVIPIKIINSQSGTINSQSGTINNNELLFKSSTDPDTQSYSNLKVFIIETKTNNEPLYESSSDYESSN
jgi:hypothetical protein